MSTNAANLTKLKARLQARLAATKAAGTPPPPKAPPDPAANAIAKKIASLAKKSAARRRYIPRRPPGPDAFTENERALLLRGVVDALRSRPDAPRFSVWHRYGLSRIYFADHSWLSYGPDSLCCYGPDKTGTAYAMRRELGLQRRARKGVLKD
jgi:hypothetical protein